MTSHSNPHPPTAESPAPFPETLPPAASRGSPAPVALEAPVGGAGNPLARWIDEAQEQLRVRDAARERERDRLERARARFSAD